MTSRKLEIKYVPIDAVKPWGRNPKKHNKKAILESIKRFKPTQPILVQKGTGLIIAGHGRLEAFKELGYEEIPITELEMSDAEARAYALVDNQTVIAGGWDDDLLLSNLQELKLELPELDMTIFGFSDKHTEKKTEEDDFDVDAAIDDDVEPITKPGDLIILGEHRLLCGDSTKKEDVERLMGGQKADMAFTDPPYNIGYSNMDGSFRPIENDKMDMDDFAKFLDRALSFLPKTSYVCCNWQTYCSFFSSLNRVGLPVKSCIVWDKETPAQNLDRYYKAHEFILYTGKFGGEKTLRSDVWRLKREVSKLHPTMKPIALIEMALQDNPDASNVLDLFGGSGSTLIACEQLGRKCFMMEIDPRYCDVIVQRWESFTNKRAVRT